MMGTFRVRVRVFSPDDPARNRDVEMLVDTGATRTLVPHDVVTELGLGPEKEQSFVTGDGRRITRAVGYAEIEYEGDSVLSLVVLGEPGDEPVLGALTLEDLALQVDPVRRVLRPADQYLLAVA